MHNQKYHYYKCHNPEKAPQPYAIYDYSKGVIGYNNKLVKHVASYFNLKYIGNVSENDFNKPVKSHKPAKLYKQKSIY